MNPRAVVLLSGGVDSATCLALARQAGFDCYAMSFDYGQRHRSELNAAKTIANSLSVNQHNIVTIDSSCFSGSALTSDQIDVPNFKESNAIPVTYVPARNIVFLAYAAGWAEVLGTTHIYIGVNAIDYSGYPDCRPEFIQAFTQAIQTGTKQGVEGHKWQIHTPLIALTKAEIILKGLECNLDYGLTVSCYRADDSGAACGRCDSCAYRKKGFAEAGVADPTRYQN